MFLSADHNRQSDQPAYHLHFSSSIVLLVTRLVSRMTSQTVYRVRQNKLITQLRLVTVIVINVKECPHIFWCHKWLLALLVWSSLSICLARSWVVVSPVRQLAVFITQSAFDANLSCFEPSAALELFALLRSDRFSFKFISLNMNALHLQTLCRLSRSALAICFPTKRAFH